jgi:epoxyqueuosine reductase
LTAAARLADELRTIGRRAGLEGVGICDAGPFSQARAAIEERKRSGEAAGMQFTFRRPARSTDPVVTMPGARALFVGARSYLRRPGPDVGPESGAPVATGAAGGGPSARVARYSWVDHYVPLRQALGQVAARLRDEGWQARVLADDNALVDRAAAVRAGIGWYGKNANVLLPGLGSWFVLGSVLTDAPIAPMQPVPAVPDGCGTCRRCMADCPTGALVAPGRLDARRCLAWLVQAAGPFPVEYRAALGDRLYGCDECQERCPVNRRAERAGDIPPAETGAQATLSVLDLLAASDADLLTWIGRWYIPGRDVRYVRRNALVVLGNVGDPADPRVEAALAKYLAGGDPLLQAHAVWAARRIGRADLLAGVRAEDPMVADELVRTDV